jgi:hypothetical protein
VDSFLSAVHHFTVIRVLRSAAHPIDTATLVWTPIVGLLTAIFTICFYFPLSVFYLPTDVAVIPALVAACWLRGFKPEIDFCRLIDSFFGSKEHPFSVAGTPGITCLIFAMLFKYVIVRQFFLLESIRLLAFGTLISFVVPLLHPERAIGWIRCLGIFWLVVSAIAAFSPVKALSSADLLVALRGPVLASALIYLCVRLTFRLADETDCPNIAALPAELSAYLSFMLVRYHFL